MNELLPQRLDRNWRARTAPWLLSIAVLLASCGGGSGGASVTPNPPAATPPVIATQVTSQDVNVGAAVTFSVTATGSGPISYQWKRDGRAIVGATAASYTLPAAKTSDSGSLWLVTVSNTAGTVDSLTASLHVTRVRTMVAGSPGGPGSSLVGVGRLDRPSGVAIDADNTLYIRDRSSLVKMNTSGVLSAVQESFYLACCGRQGGIAVSADGYPYAIVGNSIVTTLIKGTPSTAIVAGERTGDLPYASGPGSLARFNHPDSLVVDPQRIVYIADTGNGTIRKLLPDYTSTTLAGSEGILRVDDGVGAAAHFAAPRGIARDKSGNLYVGDQNTIRKITPAGVVTTLAGVAGQAGTADGPAGVNRLGKPNSLAVDSAGNILIADSGNFTIRKLTPAGVLSTITGVIGQGDDSGNTLPVDSAYIAQELGYIAIDSADNLFFADTNNSVVRKLTPGGVLSTVVGVRAHAGNVDGTGTAARFDKTGSIAVDATGNVYISANNTLRKVTAGGITTSLTALANPNDGTVSAYYPAAIPFDGSIYGTGTDGTVFKINAQGVRALLAGHKDGDAIDGVGAAAGFSRPGPLTVDPSGNVYLIDRAAAGEWESVRKVTPAGVVTTIAGYTGGVGHGEPLTGLKAIEVDRQGNVYVIAGTLLIKIAPDGKRTIVAGTDPASGLHAVYLHDPSSLALDLNGNVYVADGYYSHIVYKIAPDGTYSQVTEGLGRITGLAVDASFLYLMNENTLFKVDLP